MKESELMRIAVTQYARNYIRVRHNEAGRSFAQIAEELECTSSYIQQINNVAAHPNLKVGLELEFVLAKRLHSGSVDGLRKAALHMYGGARVIAAVDGDETQVHEFSNRDTKQQPPSSAPPNLPEPASSGGSRRRIKRARAR